tara:strand:+ start:216 stop:413 length:198 start_codon:yes stop_codon:yes gene_type:complete
MIKVKTRLGDKYINVINIVSIEQDEKKYVRIWHTHQGYTETTEEFDVVVKKIEKMLIQIAGSQHV